MEDENIREPLKAEGAEDEKERGLRRIVEESEYEDEDESENEEILHESVRFEETEKYELFPVLAPPQEFQNCLSPSAIYDMTSGYDTSRSSRYVDNSFPISYEKSVIRASVASPAYSQDSMSSQMTSSSATEKSVRFSDRDYILSTPEPQPISRHCGDTGDYVGRVKGILKSEGRVPDVTSFMLDNEDGTLV